MIQHPSRLNCQQVSTLRSADPDTGRLSCDACTGRALATRGFAHEAWIDGRRHFLITDDGRARARKAADIREKNIHTGNPESFFQEMLRDQESA